ncbi:hypothetical protein ACBI99_34560 [Nonomuraea sp. ATR24]|uniref:hypothetical protein n=1 Tax=Nonomuraea sp. ATR24 TaxID=1676744 RepID=UPI0035C03FD0
MPSDVSSGLSPCAHTPQCPPPACLPASLRAQPVSADPEARGGKGGNDPQGGVAYAVSKIVAYAETMDLSADVVSRLKSATPRFEGWNLAPIAGIPAIGLMFVNRINTIADTWADCAKLLDKVLEEDGSKLFKVAENYAAAHAPSVTAAQRTAAAIDAADA